jgi:hypothetical protein
VLKFIKIKYKKFIYNINKKGARICVFIKEEVIVLVNVLNDLI